MDSLNKFQRLIRIFLIILLLISLVGCANENSEFEPAPKPHDPAVWLLFNLDDYIVQKPVKRGDFFILAIPRSDLFNRDSANFTSGSEKILNNVSSLMLCYDKLDVKVMSYIFGENQNIFRGKSLARKQSNQVVDYLWDKGIDARLAYPEGYVMSSRYKFVDKIVISFQVFGRN